MKALVKSEARPGIWLKDIAVPTVGAAMSLSQIPGRASLFTSAFI